jgi:hypothetical protein
MQEEDNDNGCFIVDDDGTVRAAAATVLFKKALASITIPRPNNNNIELAHRLILTTTPFLNVSFLYFSKTL